MTKLIGLIILSSLLSSCCLFKASSSSVVQQTPPDLETVVTAIQNQYAEALIELKKDGITDIEISEADLSLAITKVFTADGSIKVLIFKPERKYINTRTTTVTYVLAKAKDTKGGAKPKVKDESLKSIIVATAKNFDKLKASVDGLVKDSFSIDLVFSIENDTNADLSFDIWGLSVDASAEWDKTTAHELKITFNIVPPKQP